MLYNNLSINELEQLKKVCRIYMSKANPTDRCYVNQIYQFLSTKISNQTINEYRADCIMCEVIINTTTYLSIGYTEEVLQVLREYSAWLLKQYDKSEKQAEKDILRNVLKQNTLEIEEYIERLSFREEYAYER